MDESEQGSISRRNLMRAAVGATAAAATASTGAAQEDGGGGGGGTTTVDMTDGLKFEPEEVTIAPGDTVVWENVGSIGHSVTAYEEDIPDGAEYWASGGFSSESDARGGYPSQGDVPGGESYEHTFETTGTHEYFCIPHEGAGMVGSVVVQEGGAGGGEEPSGPTLPGAANTLMIAALAAMSATLSIAYFFLKYGGSGPAPEPE